MIVEDEQLSLAIGKSGQNVRLASKLTGWSIDIRSKKELVKERLEASMTEEAVSQQTSSEVVEAAGPGSDLESLDGIGPKTAEALREAGYKTLEDLRNAKPEALAEVKGIGKKTLEKILGNLNAGS